MNSEDLYRSLTEKLESHGEKLYLRYGQYIRCRSGCSSCCILESIFPVEAAAIARYFSSGVAAALPCFEPVPGMCPFLHGDICTIYPVRPVICRTHGYPIQEDGRVDFCPENFKGLDTLESEYILDLENLNRALVAINMIFMKENSLEFFNRERITMTSLREYICSLNS